LIYYKIYEIREEQGLRPIHKFQNKQEAIAVQLSIQTGDVLWITSKNTLPYLLGIIMNTSVFWNLILNFPKILCYLLECQPSAINCGVLGVKVINIIH